MLKLIINPNLYLIALLAFFFSEIKFIYGHAILEYSEPARRSVLYRPPNKIILTFNERIEESFAKIKIMDYQDKLILTNQKASNLKDDKKSIFITIPELSEGVYFIQYEVISVDGHKVKGRYKFTIKKN